MRIYYDGNCTRLREDTKIDQVDGLDARTFTLDSGYYSYRRYQERNCRMGSNVVCVLQEPFKSNCRLNVRMSAAFVLMGCLVIKALYMCAVNLLARGKLKQHCLTFGDVIIASASHPELRVQGYATFA